MVIQKELLIQKAIQKEPVSDGDPKGAIDTNGYPKGASIRW